MDNSKSICRGCMSTNSNEFEIFFDNELPAVYQSLTNLQVAYGDGLPQVICTPCVQNLKNFQLFKEECINSYKELKNQEIVKVECEQIIDFKTEHEQVADSNDDYFEATECSGYTESLQPVQQDVQKLECKTESMEKLPALELNSNKADTKNESKKVPSIKSGYFSCDLCGKRFQRKQYLKNHMETHNLRGRTHKCNICSKLFVRLPELKRHIKLRHTTREKSFQCSSCDRKFNNEKALTSHSVIHLDVLPFSCDICEKRFVSKGTLRVHSRLHTDNKPYLCTICAQRFSQSLNLQFHMNRHTGNRPFACKLCPKTFAQPSNLIEHEQRHHGTKNTPRGPFICPICSKQYNEKRSLTRHIAQHTAEKKHICETCSKGFFDSTGLKRHRLVHSSEKKFECPICGKYLTRKDHLKAHMRKHETRLTGDF